MVELVAEDGSVIVRYLFVNAAQTYPRAKLPLQTGWTLRIRVADLDTGETIYEDVA